MINRDHLLLCTIPFKTQLEHLFEDDFRAIVTTLEEYVFCVNLSQSRLDNGENLVFYNCGMDSGASQLHKHVQILPTTNEVREQFFTCYLDLYDQYSSKHFTRIPELHFKHAYRSLTNLFQKDHDTIVQQLLSTYKQMLCELNLYTCKPSSRVETKCVHCKGDGYDETHTVTIRDGECPSYNLIFTRKWMLIVPRCRESVDSIR
jgi:ATP adenylyltransferase